MDAPAGTASYVDLSGDALSPQQRSDQKPGRDIFCDECHEGEPLDSGESWRDVTCDSCHTPMGCELVTNGAPQESVGDIVICDECHADDPASHSDPIPGSARDVTCVSCHTSMGYEMAVSGAGPTEERSAGSKRLRPVTSPLGRSLPPASPTPAGRAAPPTCDRPTPTGPCQNLRPLSRDGRCAAGHPR